jgi:pimeloyl-ACP methyl ester carboxylesterase
VRDLIVVVPGILGSRLVRNGKEIWGLPGGIAHNLAHPEATLTLEGDGYDVDPSVNADGLVRAPVHFPGLAKVDGLRRLVRFLRQRVPSDHLLVFPYDWRLSNRVNGRLLAALVEQWRRWSRDRDAKLVLVCHSMGGLVARAFLDLEGGAAQCRRLFTVGTPYFGSVKALGCLVNGVYSWAGRIGEELTTLVRTWPSVYELLPTYPAVVGPCGNLTSLAEIDGLDRERFQDARAFHDDLHGAVKARHGQPPPYEITAVIGAFQPTAQFARITPGQVQLLTEHDGVDLRGDGTVPRQAACPPDWDDDGRGTFFAHTHLSLPSSRRVLDHLHAVLTAVPRPPMAVTAGLAIQVPELVWEGEPFEVVAEATAPRLALRAEVVAVDGGTSKKQIVEPRDGQQAATFPGLAPGTYLATISAAAPSVRGVEPVTDAFTVWPRT